MAGKPKKRIDYAGWSVDMFTNDTKIDKLLDAQGWDGFGVYFYLCQMAFGSEGYFYEWGYTLCATTARKMGGHIGAGTVKETVDYCLHIGLFDKGLYDGWGVLTSRGIQKSYLVVLKSKNRQGTEIYNEYWLLDKNGKDYQGVIFVSKNNEQLLGYDHLLEVDSNSLGENDHSLAQEDSKVKDSKVKKDIVHSGEVHDAESSSLDKFYESIWKLYPLKKGKGQVSKSKKQVLQRIGYKQIECCIDRYVREIKTSRKEKYMMHGSTFFNSGYVDYLDENYIGMKEGEDNGKAGSRIGENENGLVERAIAAGITGDFEGF